MLNQMEMDMIKEDIRWQHRFQNFEKAFLFLKECVELGSYDQIQAAGLIKSFEFTFELGWKTLKDFLSEKSQRIPYPRDIIKQSFEDGLVEDEHTWIRMLEKRNELFYAYDEIQSQKAVKVIGEDYFPAIENVYKKLLALRCSD